MSKNIAIVIGVTEYANQNNLPAGRNDAAAIAEILGESRRFEDILVIDTDITGASVRDHLAAFVSRHQDTAINEVFFYFSGHGEMNGDDFYFKLTDYEKPKKRQTSLTNSELDEFVRPLAPELYTKIVDACYSGVSYIKSDDAPGGGLDEVKPTFKKLYFMFSSRSDQKSWQEDNLSHFTECIVRAIIDHSSDRIRYKDVANYVSDYFETYDWQAPWFVQQSSNIDIFCEVTSELKSRLRARLPTNLLERNLSDAASSEEQSVVVDEPLLAPGAEPAKALTLREQLESDARRYVTKEQAIELLERLNVKLQSCVLPSELDGLFEKSVGGSEEYPPDAAVIGTWVSQSKADPRFFAKPTYRTESYKKRVPKGGALGSSWNALLAAVYDRDEDFKYVDAYRDIVDGYVVTSEAPYTYLKLNLEANLPNVSPKELYIAPIISPTTVKICWGYRDYEFADWGRHVATGKVKWSATDVPLSAVSDVDTAVEDIWRAFCGWVKELLEQQILSRAE